MFLTFWLQILLARHAETSRCILLHSALRPCNMHPYMNARRGIISVYFSGDVLFSLGSMMDRRIFTSSGNFSSISSGIDINA